MTDAPSYATKWVKCPNCDGKGKVLAANELTTCPDCRGKGKVRRLK